MITSYINPLYLPLVPPMDLNKDNARYGLLSPYQMQLRLTDGEGLFGTRRSSGDHIHGHNGIDLLAPVGTKIYAASDGIVKEVSTKNILIQHDNAGFNYLTFYSHLQNVLVSVGSSVFCGQPIGEVGLFDGKEDHLHFEVRYPFDNAAPSRINSLTVDPTFAMYHWEIKAFSNTASMRYLKDKVIITSLEEVIRGRQLRFLLCKVESEAKDLYLPLQTGLPEDDSLAETIKQAFFSGKKVQIVWRESLFFSKIQNSKLKTPIITEIKVYH